MSTIPGVKVFLSEKISQDTLEKFFGCQHQSGGTSDDPTLAEFLKNTNALPVTNTVCRNVLHGKATNIYVTQKRKILRLPKRRRYHK